MGLPCSTYPIPREPGHPFDKVHRLGFYFPVDQIYCSNDAKGRFVSDIGGDSPRFVGSQMEGGIAWKFLFVLQKAPAIVRANYHVDKRSSGRGGGLQHS